MNKVTLKAEQTGFGKSWRVMKNGTPTKFCIIKNEWYGALSESEKSNLPDFTLMRIAPDFPNFVPMSYTNCTIRHALGYFNQGAN